MDTTPDRIGLLAQSLDFFTEADFIALAGIKAATAEAWRKRGKGPAHVRLGNRVLYPRAAVAEFLKSNVKQRHRVGVAAAL
jgi:predicted site-specific integrase-resolvase